ncbi:MAG: DUF6680 family protein [Mucilaginibacter sp.]
MQPKDWINILAILISPVFAVCITLWYQNRAEKLKTKRSVFFTLMKYRNSIHIPNEYVEALNSIDVVFHKQQNIVNLWAEYYDNLCSDNPNISKRGHLKIDLLAAIAKHLGYERLKQTQIDRYYEPILYQNQQNRQQEISDELLRTLKASENYGTPRIKGDNA